MNKHTHRFQRINIGQKGKIYLVMKCIKPGCSHYVPMSSKSNCILLKGQIGECNKCLNDFILNKRSLRMAKPICDDCVAHRVGTVERVKDVDSFFKELESSLGEHE